MFNARRLLGALIACVVLIFSGAFVAISSFGAARDKCSLKVPGGLAFSEFKGYEAWEAVSVSSDESAIAVILANPVMVNALQGWHPCQRQAGARWRKDGEGALASQEEPALPQRDGAWRGLRLR